MEVDLKKRTLEMASGIMKSSNFTRQLTYGAETTANGWPDGRSMYHTILDAEII